MTSGRVSKIFGARWVCAGLCLWLGLSGPFAPSARADIGFADSPATETALPPSLYSQVMTVPVFNVDTGRLRFLTGFKDIERRYLYSRLFRYTRRDDLELYQAPLFSTGDGTGAITCDCERFLEPGEFIVSETPVKNGSSTSFLSLNDESYKAVMELIDFPLETDAMIAVSFSELVYVYNARAIERFLDRRGFDLVYSYGFMESPVYPGESDAQFIIARERAGGRFIICVRGTSGVADLKTNVDAAMVPWAGSGRVHKGFADIMEIVRKAVEDHRAEINRSGQPVLVTGHSLGASVAVLLTIVMRDAGMDAHAITCAPAPMGDREFEAAYGERRDVIENLFLPGEELDTAGKLDMVQWMRLIGTKRYLDDVGKTAGATHFVINYLKGILKLHDLPVVPYERSVPLCVLDKFYCFDGGVIQFTPLCTLDDWGCFAANADFVFGLDVNRPGTRALDLLIGRLDDVLGGTAGGPGDPDRSHLLRRIRSLKARLVSETLSGRMRTLIMLRLAFYDLLVGRGDEALRFLALVRPMARDTGVIETLEALAHAIAGRREKAEAAAARALRGRPPEAIELRLSVLTE